MLTLSEFEAAASQLPSLTAPRHLWMLLGLIRWLQPESVVEIGSYAGGSAVWLARGLQDNGKGTLTLIDDFSLDPSVKPNLFYHLGLCRVGERVQIADGPSTDPNLWPDRVDLCFVDGDHSYEGCAGDVKQAMDRGASCVVLHDTGDDGWWGPQRFVAEFAAAQASRDVTEGLREMMGRSAAGTSGDSWDLIGVPFEGGLTVLMKRPVITAVGFTEEEHPSGAVELVAAQ